MQLPCFYEKDISFSNSTFILSEETAKHCVQVLRMQKDDVLQLTNGNGNLYTVSIAIADKKNCEVVLVNSGLIQQKERKVSIAISLLKNNSRFEWFLEKATEIGIIEILPLVCARTEREHFRFDRMNNILVSAMLQSRQVWLPILHEPVIFAEAVVSSAYRQKLIAHCEDSEKNSIKNLAVVNEVQIFIGPEGDFSAPEIKLALQNGFKPVSLGNTRLRSETAGIVSASLLMNL